MTQTLLIGTSLLLGLSLLFQFLPPFGRAFLRTSSLYWLVSLSLLIGSTLLFALSPFLPPTFLSLANTLGVAVFYALALMLMALKKQDPRWGWPWLLVGMVFFFLGFELLRQQGDAFFVARVVVVAFSFMVGAIALTAAVLRHDFRPGSWHLSLMCLFALVGGLLMVKRAEVIYLGDIAPIYTLQDETGFTLGLRWVSSICVYMCFLLMRNHLGERLLLQMERQRARAEDAVFSTLTRLSTERHAASQSHVLRLQQLVRLIATSLEPRGDHAEPLTQRQVAMMVQTCVLHDVGQMIVPAPGVRAAAGAGTLESPDFRSIPLLGEQVLRLSGQADSEPPSEHMLQTMAMAREIAGARHERWDGTGYPRGLAGEAIPLAARVVAVADSFNTLLHESVHREECSFDEAVIQIERLSGTAFDPAVVRAFLTHIRDLQGMASRPAA